MSRNARTTRSFLLPCGLGASLLLAPLAADAQSSGSLLSSLDSFAERQARVATVADPRATELFSPKPDRVRLMTTVGLTNLTGTPTVAEAWRSLVSTQETIGIKVFTSPGPTIGTRLTVVASVVEGLLQAGFPPAQLLVWDRDHDDLREAGYDMLVRRYGIRLGGALQAGFDEEVFYENSLLGRLIYGDHEFQKKGEDVGRKSFVSSLVTTGMTRIVLISPLLNHNRAGVCGHLYSLAMGSTDNNIRFEAAPDRLAMAVPEICALPELGDRVVLCITDGLICQYQGQEQGLLHYSTMLNELRFSADPVALDVLSIRELQEQRERAGITTGILNRELFENAALLQIGISNPARIQAERIKLPAAP